MRRLILVVLLLCLCSCASVQKEKPVVLNITNGCDGFVMVSSPDRDIIINQGNFKGRVLLNAENVSFQSCIFHSGLKYMESDEDDNE